MERGQSGASVAHVMGIQSLVDTAEAESVQSPMVHSLQLRSAQLTASTQSLTFVTVHTTGLSGATVTVTLASELVTGTSVSTIFTPLMFLMLTLHEC